VSSPFSSVVEHLTCNEVVLGSIPRGGSDSGRILSMGITLYRNLDIGHIPPTPSIPFVSGDALDVAKSTLLTFAKIFGTPIGYKQEQDGSLFQHIIPASKTEYGQISTSSKSNLELHTETAFHPYRPSFVLLLCLRGDKNAVTTYADDHEILSHLKLETVEILQQPLFITRVDDSFRTNGEPDVELVLPILRNRGDRDWEITYDSYFMRGVNQEAQDALDEFNAAIEKSTREIVLDSGQLLVINNKNTVHGRKPFTARYDGTDRWLMRVLVIKNIPPRSHIDGSVIITEFRSTK